MKGLLNKRTAVICGILALLIIVLAVCVAIFNVDSDPQPEFSSNTASSAQISVSKPETSSQVSEQSSELLSSESNLPAESSSKSQLSTESSPSSESYSPAESSSPVSSSPSAAKNTRSKLPLITPDGDDMAYHPSVVRFDSEWNGYKYWMAFTPYPNSDATKENPVINVSINMKEWFVPAGLVNPLDIPQPSDKNHYNSDTHLIYNPNEDRLELFWRYVCDDGGKIGSITIYQTVSYDGVNWSDKSVFLYLPDRDKADYVSPAIILENGVYRMWYVDVDKKVYYAEIVDGIIGDAVCLDIEYDEPMNSWHIDVSYNKDKAIYEMVLCSYKPSNDRRTMSLYYTSSSDNTHWSKAECILKPSSNSTAWDSQGLYRACLIYDRANYYLFYSAHGAGRANIGVGLMYGQDIFNLKSYI